MSTFNICFHGEIRKKYLPDTPLLSGAILLLSEALSILTLCWYGSIRHFFQLEVLITHKICFGGEHGSR